MNSIEIEKIKQLVNKSSILSAQERAEWLALLGLMNDRQLSELEKILNSRVNKVNPIYNIQYPSQSLPKAASFANSPAQPKLPPLSHIVNLPNNFSGQPSHLPQKPSPQGVTPEALAKRILEEKSQRQPTAGQKNFAAKLKNIFSEKELPGEVMAQNLELTPPAIFKEKVLPAAPIAPAVPLAKPIPPVAKPLPPVPKLKIPVFPPAAVKPVLQNLRPQNSGPVFSAGINFAKPPGKTTEERVAEIKQHSQARVVTEVAPKASLVKAVVGLESLDSLTQVNLEELQNYSLDSLATKIKLLTRQFGYFEVIFNLEKSPAYRSYIQTGLKLLSDGQGFEELFNGEYLTREQFEKFTDLLAKIQTGA